MTLKGRTNDLICSISLANLLFIKQWHSLLSGYFTERSKYAVETFFTFESFDVTPAALLALPLTVLLVAGVVFSCLRFAARFPSHGPQVGNALIALLSCFLLNTARHYLNVSAPVALAFVLVAMLPILLFCKKFRLPTSNLLRASLTLFFPLFLTLSATAAVRAVDSQNLVDSKKRIPILAQRTSSTRVILMVFDRLGDGDKYWRIVGKPKSPFFQEFEKKNTAFTNVNSPGRSTINSFVSLFQEQKVTGALRWTKEKKFLYRLEGSQSDQEFNFDSHLFQRLHKTGIRSAVIGYTLPFCQLYGRYLSQCERYPFHEEERPSYSRHVLANIQQFISEIRLARNHGNAEYPKRVQQQIQRSLQIATDPDLDFIVLHYPFPHDPIVFDAVQGKILKEAIQEKILASNMPLVDQTIASFFSHLDASPLANRTVVFVTGDHGFNDTQVPLIVRHGLGNVGEQVTTPFNTLALGKWITGLLTEKLPQSATVAQVQRFIQ